MTLGFQVCLLISWHEYVQWCDEVHAYVTQMDYELTKVYTNDRLAMNMLKNIYSYCILECEHMTRYSKCHKCR